MKRSIPEAEAAQPYLMGVADKLSDDPLLARILGSRFKAIVSYDLGRRRTNCNGSEGGKRSLWWGDTRMLRPRALNVPHAGWTLCCGSRNKSAN